MLRGPVLLGKALLRCRMVLYGPAKRSALRQGVSWRGKVLSGRAQYSEVWFGRVMRSTVRHGISWRGLVLLGLVRSCPARFRYVVQGSVWCFLARFSIVRFCEALSC